MALAYKGITESELARRIDTSPQAFHQRLKTDKFSTEELDKIASALDAVYTYAFEFPDGTKI